MEEKVTISRKWPDVMMTLINRVSIFHEVWEILQIWVHRQLEVAQGYSQPKNIFDLKIFKVALKFKKTSSKWRHDVVTSWRRAFIFTYNIGNILAFKPRKFQLLDLNTFLFMIFLPKVSCTPLSLMLFLHLFLHLVTLGLPRIHNYTLFTITWAKLEIGNSNSCSELGQSALSVMK